jgi:hypothetical protein
MLQAHTVSEFRPKRQRMVHRVRRWTIAMDRSHLATNVSANRALALAVLIAVNTKIATSAQEALP